MDMNTSKIVKQLQAQLITPENFARYGQVIFLVKMVKPSTQKMLN